MKEPAADEDVTPGSTALTLHHPDGYGALPSAIPLPVVLLVGTGDTTAANEPFRVRFSEALDRHGVDHELIVVPDATHRDLFNPSTDAGQTTLEVIAGLLDEAR